MDVSGKVFFITGGAAGLGKAHTEELLGRGAKVAFTDVNPTVGLATLKEFQTRFGPENVRFSSFDVSDKKEFEDAFKAAVSTFGQVDVMVNNAGILNEGLWEIMIPINYTAVVWGTKLAMEHMRKDKGGKGGRIINVSSICGLTDLYYMPVYSGTKHAVRSFTSCLANAPNQEELGVECAVLCPNAAATDLIFKADETKMHFLDDAQALVDQTLVQVPQVVKGFLQLVQLEKMNGAILWVQKDETTLVRMKMEDINKEVEKNEYFKCLRMSSVTLLGVPILGALGFLFYKTICTRN